MKRRAKPQKKAGTTWTPEQDRKLKKLIKLNTPTPLMAWELGRTKAAVYAHASKIGKSVKPTNKSPYNRRKKR